MRLKKVFLPVIALTLPLSVLFFIPMSNESLNDQKLSTESAEQSSVDAYSFSFGSDYISIDTIKLNDSVTPYQYNINYHIDADINGDHTDDFKGQTIFIDNNLNGIYDLGDSELISTDSTSSGCFPDFDPVSPSYGCWKSITEAEYSGTSLEDFDTTVAIGVEVEYNTGDFETEIGFVQTRVTPYDLPYLVDDLYSNDRYSYLWDELESINPKYTIDSDEYYIVSFFAFPSVVDKGESLPIEEIILLDSNMNSYYPVDSNYSGILVDINPEGSPQEYYYFYAVFDKSEVTNYSYYVNVDSRDPDGNPITVEGETTLDYYIVTIEDNATSLTLVAIITILSIALVTGGITFIIWYLKKKETIA